MAGLLHLAEEVQGAAGHGFALRQTGSRVIQLLPAQHKLLKLHEGKGKQTGKVLFEVRLYN